MMRSRHWPLLAALAALLLMVGIVWLLRPGGAPPAPQPAAMPVDPAAISASDQLNAAENAAFPDGRVGETESGAVIRYEPGILVEAPFGPVLVSEGRVPDAAHVDSGSVAIHYLAREGQGFRLVRAFPGAVQAGSFGRLSNLMISGDFSRLPVVVTQGGGTWQGYSCSWTTLTELAPQGPVELVSFMDSSDDSGAAPDGAASTTQGTIVKIVQGLSFTVQFKGSRNFDALYVRKGNRYELQGGDAKALQGC